MKTLHVCDRDVFIFSVSCLSVQVTECEIFLSLLIKFLDPEKSQWQRVTALEVLAKLSVQPQLIRFTILLVLLFSTCDMCNAVL